MLEHDKIKYLPYNKQIKHKIEQASYIFIQMKGVLCNTQQLGAYDTYNACRE